jgi:hypothetical protein
MEQSDPRLAERIQLTRRYFAHLGGASAVAWGASPLAAADADVDRLLSEAALKLEYLTHLQHHDLGSSFGSITYSFTNTVVTRFPSARAELERCSA